MADENETTAAPEGGTDQSGSAPAKEPVVQMVVPMVEIQTDTLFKSLTQDDLKIRLAIPESGARTAEPQSSEPQPSEPAGE